MFVISMIGDRPLRLEKMSQYLIFASIEDAIDYGAPRTKIFPAKAFGVEGVTPNIRKTVISDDDCTFQFRYGDRWY